MELEIGTFRLQDVEFGPTTALRAGILSVDRRALTAHLLEDPNLAGVNVEIARPGDSTRISPHPKRRRDTTACARRVNARSAVATRSGRSPSATPWSAG